MATALPTLRHNISSDNRVKNPHSSLSLLSFDTSHGRMQGLVVRQSSYSIALNATFIVAPHNAEYAILKFTTTF